MTSCTGTARSLLLPACLLFLRRSNPIEVTRPHRSPGVVFAAMRGIFGIDAIGPDVPIRVTPLHSTILRFRNQNEGTIRRRPAHVDGDDPIRVSPKLPPLLAFTVPTG